MALVAPNSAEILLLQYLVNMVASGHPVLHLYSSNTTPSESTVIGDLTQSSETGYAPVTLTGSNWTTTQSLGVTTAVYSEQIFTFTTAATVYGYYVTTTSNALLWVERFSAAPFSLPDDGGEIAITTKITLD